MIKLTAAQIVRLNQMTIEQNGGQFIPPNNFLHSDQLDYLVEMVDAEMFGESLYPTIADKAALYMFNVISNHIFSDGNKRTGLTAALTFLLLNGYELKSPLLFFNPRFDNFIPSDNDYNSDLEKFTLEVASSKYTLEQVRAWFNENIKPI